MAIQIFVNRLKREAPQEQMTGAEILALADFGNDHDLFKLQGEGDRTGGTQIAPTETVDVKSGDHFRAIPGNRNFGR